MRRGPERRKPLIFDRGVESLSRVTNRLIVSSDSTAPDIIPGGFSRPTSVFISGTNRALLRWFAFALLTPYGSRVYWTDVRLPGEIPDAIDPITLREIPENRVYVLSPRDLQPDDHGARQAEAAAATMLHSDEPSESLRGLVEFLRMPAHAQKLISSTGRVEEPSILVTANAHRLATVYDVERVAPLMEAMLKSGTCQVALWAEAPTTNTTMFEMQLRLEGGSPHEWRDATIQAERGVSSGPLAPGKPVRLSQLGPIARVLEKMIPASAPGQP